MNLFKSIAVLSLAAAWTTSAEASTTADEALETVRGQCETIFKAAFKDQSWVALEDLDAFVELLSPKATVFACPVGNREKTILADDLSKEAVKGFFEKFGFVPSEGFQYTEDIASDIDVVGKVCSFDKYFVGVLGGSCLVTATSRQVIEVDEDGLMVSWLDYFNEKKFLEKIAVCTSRFEQAGAETD